MRRIHTILSSIATEISDEMHDNTRDEREDRLIQEIESAITYYYNQWDILNEARPSTFELEQLGELAQSPAELAFDILYTTFLNEYWGALEDVKRVPESHSTSKENQLIAEGLVPIDHVTDRLAPRTCSLTGNGMYNGWVWGDGEFYTSTEKLTLKELEKCRKDIIETLIYNGYEPTEVDMVGPEFTAVALKVKNGRDISGVELLTLAYGLGILYWTEW